MSRAHNLLTNGTRRKLIAAHERGQETGESSPAIVKLFNPAGAETWYISEGYEDENEGWILYGFCNLGDPTCAEFGSVFLKELEGIRLRWGLRIERDLYFTPRPLAEIAEVIKDGGHI